MLIVFNPKIWGVFQYHLHHLRVIKVIDNVFQDVPVGHKAQGTEHDDDGHFLSDVRQGGDDPLTNGTLLHSLEDTPTPVNGRLVVL